MNTAVDKQDTIAAIATAKGVAGVGIIRISGSFALRIAQALVRKNLKPRYATYTNFFNSKNEIIDSGIAIFFPAPNSFTGEDVLELHGHGGSVVLDCLLREILNVGARIARPGEFSERAFLNNKIDLAQAEAVMDLIHAQSQAAALAATQTLRGVFSEKISILTQEIINIRMYVEAAIDFAEEAIAFLQDNKIITKIAAIKSQVLDILAQANIGTKLNDGVKAVILGKPNTGKSSLLNALSGEQRAIVTDIPGTTRDVLYNAINIDGLTLNLVDTAGLRISGDVIEQEGIRRAIEELKTAELLMLMLDGSEDLSADLNANPFAMHPAVQANIADGAKRLLIINKIDKINLQPKVETMSSGVFKVYISASTGAGLDLLKNIIKEIMGLSLVADSAFTARRRHVHALETAVNHIQAGESRFQLDLSGELLAEELRLAHMALEEITGKFSTDDLLGKIFSEFCIGK